MQNPFLLKVFLPVFLVFGNILLCNSQIIFNKNYDFNDGYESILSINEVESGYILIGGGWATEYAGWQSLKYCKIDKQGNLIWQKVIGKIGVAYYPSTKSILLEDNSIVTLCHTTIDGDANAFLIRFDVITGDTIFTKSYDIDGDQVAEGVFEFSDGSLLLHIPEVFAPQSTRFIKTDTYGNIIWNKSFGSGEGSGTLNIVIDSSDDIWFAEQTHSGCNPAGFTIYQIDSSGTLLNQINTTDGCVFNIVNSITGGYIGVNCSCDLSIFPPTYDFELNKILDDGKIDWSYVPDIVLYPTTFNNIVTPIENSSGHIYCSGSYQVLNDLEIVGFLQKISSTGNLLWRRDNITGTDLDNIPSYVYTFNLTNDGGFILGGSTSVMDHDAVNQNFWVIKLDSNGCLNAGCDSLDHINDSTLTDFPSNDFLTIYPNPIHTNATIQINTDNLNISGVNYLEFETYDISGKLIDEFTVDKFSWTVDGNKIQINYQVQNLSSGMYLIKLKSDGDVSGIIKFVFL